MPLLHHRLRRALLRALDPRRILRPPPRLRLTRRRRSRNALDDRRARDSRGGRSLDPAIGAESCVGLPRATEYVCRGDFAGAEEGSKAGVQGCAGVYGDDVCWCRDELVVCEGVEGGGCEEGEGGEGGDGEGGGAAEDEECGAECEECGGGVEGVVGLGEGVEGWSWRR